MGAWDNVSKGRKKEMTGINNSAKRGLRGIVYFLNPSFGINHSSTQQLFYAPEILVIINLKHSS